MSVQIMQADAERLPLADRSVDLVFGSPPYCDARTYGIGADRRCDEWIDWMLRVTLEANRVCRGPVLWVAAGVGNYQPAVEGLIYRLWKSGERVLRPCIWTKNAPPTGKNWFSNDWEFVFGIGPVSYWNPEAIATPLKYSNGGAFRQRGKDGARRAGSAYPQHKMRKRPSNVVHCTVGGGHLGWARAHENEAPFPQKLAEHFIASLCPSGGTVCDPFSGSGTTAAAALKLGRNAIACDIRESQCQLTADRLMELASTSTKSTRSASVGCGSAGPERM